MYNSNDKWEVIQKGLERIFKEAYKLQPHYDDKAIFISHNPKEAEKMRSMGVYRLSDNFQVHFRRWYPTINKRRKRLTHKGRGVGISGLPFPLWKKYVLKIIGD